MTTYDLDHNGKIKTGGRGSHPTGKITRVAQKKAQNEASILYLSKRAKSTKSSKQSAFWFIPYLNEPNLLELLLLEPLLYLTSYCNHKPELYSIFREMLSFE